MKLQILKLFLIYLPLFFLLSSLGNYTSGFILDIYPFCPTWLLIGFLLTLFALPIYYAGKRLKQWTVEMEEAERTIPLVSYVATFWTNNYIGTLLVCIATIAFTGNFSHSSRFTDIYLDNGTKEVVHIEIPGAEEQAIQPKTYQLLSIPLGTHQVKCNGKVKNITLSQQGKWIFNPESANSYIVSDIIYGETNAINQDKGQAEGLPQIIKNELFMTSADYLFEAPQEISISKKRYETSPATVTKTVLYRLNDMIQKVELGSN
ncbi:hypothetical protein QNI16_00485 [Cytophagaceae bacterium YF14B1]|uniref:Uncharacterized protein n=1 Tax=Xanthocytophaga flava TaxID=3048013 RepID=A0AAE3U479_9BACT|nr:hypothetical protein [Xanthocytophaga flavus]MDJ1466265.1 hypothetical protein [Xanthocytophaga flavus]MDJ1478936.1 hypothetical protein [Xanthocytophaga flavus]